MRGLRPAAFLLLLANPGWAAMFSSTAKGTTAAGFLKLGAGARAIALGEAYSAMADEASALYWNPAALTRIHRHSATFMHAAYIDSSFFDYGAYALRLSEAGVLGTGFQYLSAGSLAGTDDAGTDIGYFRPNDLAVTLGYARRIESLDGLSFGLNAKLIQSQIINTARTGAVDLGALSPPLLRERLRLAFTVVNLGGKMRFEREAENLPLAMRVGGSYRIREAWSAALDVGLPRDNDPYVALGTEYLLPVTGVMKLAGRAGFNSRSIGDLDGFSAFSFGIGFMERVLALDYAIVPVGSLGLAHRVSVSCKF